jgi:hypothetical protein
MLPALSAFTESRRRLELPMPPAPMGAKISYGPSLPPVETGRLGFHGVWLASRHSRLARSGLGKDLQETASELCSSRRVDGDPFNVGCHASQIAPELPRSEEAASRSLVFRERRFTGGIRQRRCVRAALGAGSMYEYRVIRREHRRGAGRSTRWRLYGHVNWLSLATPPDIRGRGMF